MSEPDLAIVDLHGRIAALNADYVTAPPLVDPREARVNDLYYARSDRRLYVIFADSYVFYSDDSLHTLREVREVNYEGGALVPRSRQSIDMIVDTMDDSVLLVGRDRRGNGGAESGVVWRKPRGAPGFFRHDAVTPAWRTTKLGNIAAGFFGADRRRLVAFGIYPTDDARLYFSLDDGLTWRAQPMGEYFMHHVHEVYLPRRANSSRTARLWATGGDDPSGERSGLVSFDSLGADGALGPGRRAFRERPGFRIVGLTGNGTHVFAGNESVAGGVLRLHDNDESAAAQDFEVVLGKSRHDYHQFRSMVATHDGVLVSGTDSYGYTGDTVRADSGGHLYVSNNDGASFVEIPLGARWVTSIAYDDAFFWIATSASSEAGPDFSDMRASLLRLRKPSPYTLLAAPYVSKVLVADSSPLYRKAGFPTFPSPSLAPGERTFRVDMSAYDQLGVFVDSSGPGTLVLEGLAFQNWQLDEDPWHDVRTITLPGPTRKVFEIAGADRLYRHYRLRNAGTEAIAMRWLAVVGRRTRA